MAKTPFILWLLIVVGSKFSIFQSKTVARHTTPFAVSPMIHSKQTGAVSKLIHAFQISYVVVSEYAVCFSFCKDWQVLVFGFCAVPGLFVYMVFIFWG